MSPAKPKNKPNEAGKSGDTTKKASSDIDDLSYEQALAELEKIVASLEAGQPGEGGKLSLDETMSLFERGQVLTKHCIDMLDKAELRVKQLSGEALTDITPEED